MEPDLSDLLRLKPTKEELNLAKKWVLAQDAGGNWPSIVAEASSYIAKKLGYEL